MATQSAAQRRPRTAVDPDDLLAVQAAEWTDWARRNARWIIAATVLLVGALGTLILVQRNRAARAERAATAYAQVQATAASGNLPLAARDLERFIGQYGNTPEGAEARLALAQIHLTRAEPRKAIPVLQPLASDLDKPLGPQAAMLLGAAQSEAGDQPAALATFLRVGENAPEEFQREDALHSAALLREQTGDFAGAAELYRRLVTGAKENSLERSLYEMRAVEAEGRARAR